MLRNGKGNNTAARLNLIARCEIQRDVGGTHYLSHADMEYRTGLKRTAIIESNKALEDAGLIVRTGEKTRDGIDIYKISSERVREDDITDIRADREKARHGRGALSGPGPDSTPGPDSAPLPGPDSAPGGTDTGRYGYAVRTQTSTQYITVKVPGIDADASGALFPDGRTNGTTKKSGEPTSFQPWWEEYRTQIKNIGKGSPGNRAPALTAYSKALKSTTPEVLTTSMLAYMRSYDPQRGFAQHASTWLNQKGWETPWEPYTAGSMGSVSRMPLPARDDYPDDPFAA